MSNSLKSQLKQMSTRVTITNKSELEAAIASQKEIGKQQYHNYLESQNKMANQISKKAILEFLNERLESRNNRIEEINSMECATSSEKAYRLSLEINNLSKIELLESLIDNIERGKFDETEYVKEVNGALIDKRLYSDINSVL